MHRRSMTLAALFATVLFLLNGCGAIEVQAGNRFNPDLVQTALHPGQSTMADVQATLGTPYGMGSTMMPYHDSPRVTWTYFFDRGKADFSTGRIDEQLSYLFVFFKDGRFDSYIWFDTM